MNNRGSDNLLILLVVAVVMDGYGVMDYDVPCTDCWRHRDFIRSVWPLLVVVVGPTITIKTDF